MATRGTGSGSTAKKASTKRAAAKPSREFQERICNLEPSKDTESDWEFEAAVGSGALTGAAAALPTKVDLRAAWWKIGDQEDTGSCVGWATAEGVLRYHLVKEGKLRQNVRLSPRFIWMASKETDEFNTLPESFIEGAGTSLKAAMDIARKRGVVTDRLLPFHVATKMYTGDPYVFYAEAAQRKVAAYFNLRKDRTKWKKWLANHGPIMVGVQVDATWDNATATNGNLDDFKPGTVRGGHAVSVVGYLPNGRFILRNSWGTAWGDRGFAYASPGYIADAFYDESYGVTL